MIKDDSFFSKLKKLFTVKKERGVYYDPKVNYCGPFEMQAWLTKWLPFHRIFPNINKSCYLHDSRYLILFKDALDQRKNYIQLLFLKLVVDVMFLGEMLKSGFSSPLTIKYPWLVTFRTTMAFVFFVIVVVCTPFYVWLFAKRHERQNIRKEKRQ